MPDTGASLSKVVYPSQVDLSNCDREQIQFASATLAHGFLVVLQEPGLIVTQASVNTADFTGQPLDRILGQPADSWLDTACLDELRGRGAKIHADAAPQHCGRFEIGERSFNTFLHRCGGVLIAEFELRNETAVPVGADLFSRLYADVAALEHTRSVQEFLDLAVRQFREFTGFDRVMAYQFLEDGSGAVLAETVAEGHDSFLGLHYPASDIPLPARRLFKLTWVRHQPDIGYQPSPIEPAINPDTGQPLDLSYALLRSVSVMYSQYLKNMGTQSSMVITLLKNGELWGLIACHHHTGPKHVPFEIRAACEFLAHMVSLQLSGKEDQENREYRTKLQSVHAHIVGELAVSSDLVKVLIDRSPGLRDFIDAGGVAVVTGDQPLLMGKTPDASQVQKLTDWLSKKDISVFSTSRLPAVYPEASQFAETASGLLAIRISAALNDFILWFRPEFEQTVQWAGDPKKPVELSDDGQRLMPRTSFAIWKETVRQQCRPWKDVEVEAASKLRNALLEITARRVGELESLYQSLQRTNVELDAFAYIASHDLKEPLRGIHNYTQFLLEDVGEQLDDDSVSKLKAVIRLTCRMDDLLDSLLNYSRLGREGMTVKDCNVNELVEEVLDTLATRIEEGGAEVRVLGRLPLVVADYPRLGQVFTNLISNALKYNDKPLKRIEIGSRDVNGTPVFFVRDNGIGIAPEHRESIFQIFRRLHARDRFGGGTGTGLTIVRKILERHDGRIWVESEPGIGSTFLFTIGTK